MNFDFYHAIYEASTKEIDYEKKRFNQYSLYRVITALAACVFLLTGYFDQQPLYYLPGLLAVLLFIVLIRRHNRIEEKKSYQTNLQSVAAAYMARFHDDWKQSDMTGSQYVTDEDPQAKDLDLFGPNSLYQYICAASTPFGLDCLAKWLKRDETDIALIQKRQQAVAELAEKKDFSVSFQARARSERTEKPISSDAMLQSLKTCSSQRPFVLTLMMWALPAATLAFLLLGLFGVNRSWNLNLFFCLFCGQLFIAMIGWSWNNRLFGPVYLINKHILPYRRLIGTFKQERFSSEYLKDMKDRLCRDTDAETALKELEEISEAIAARHNLIAFLLYNGLFLFDFHCAKRYQSWNLKYQDSLRPWLEAVGEMEALISLSVIAQVKDTYVFPNLSGSLRPALSVRGLKHPLIADEKSVGNDFSITNSTCIITGSNMSGKTTFLRSIGINLKLAYAGGCVTAEEFDASVMKLCTSMRVEDSVSEGISTFYAELLRIKSMVDQSKKPGPMIALIDEIYKGTNSKDRIIGARETIKQLSHPHVLTIVTTHDFELCDLEKESSMDAVNYHFTEHYSETELLFDYKIRKGRCSTTNAQHLLRMAGILPS